MAAIAFVILTGYRPSMHHRSEGHEPRSSEIISATVAQVF